MGALGKGRPHFVTIFAYLCSVKKSLTYLLAVLALVSCGTLRQGGRTAPSPSSESLLTREVGIVDTPQNKPDKPKDAPSEEAASQKPSTDPSARGNAQEGEGTLSDQVIAYARTFLGTPYKLGASGPKLFDCSGFTCYVFKHFGYNLTQYSGAQFKEGREVAGYADLQKGDLVFFGKRGSVRNIGHVGIVVSVNEERGSFRFIHASTSGGVVESESTQAYYMMRYIGARRILPDEDRKD